MGTRNLTLVKLDNQFRVAQYGQWDGYPAGQGATVVQFLRSNKTKKAKEAFKAALRGLKNLTAEEVNDKWKLCGSDGSGWVGMDVSDKMKLDFPHLQRDCGANVLQLILDGKATEVFLEADFAKDSLFCEWAYVIDLDRNTLEVFKGFNKRPLAKTARFYFDGYKSEEQFGWKDKTRTPGTGYHYYPIRLKKKYSLDKVPSVKQLVADCDPKED